MGGGDLNMKKHFHPLTMENLERVWKAEEKKRQEEERISQLQQELQEERRREELQRQAVQSGLVKKKTEKLDWMYSGYKRDDADEYLLGKRIEAKHVEPEQDTSDNIPAVKVEEKLYQPKASDVLMKVKEDPLFLIKKREDESRKELAMNPLKMQKMKELLQQQIPKKEKKKKKDKKKKKSKTYSSQSEDEVERRIHQKRNTDPHERHKEYDDHRPMSSRRDRSRSPRREERRRDRSTERPPERRDVRRRASPGGRGQRRKASPDRGTRLRESPDMKRKHQERRQDRNERERRRRDISDREDSRRRNENRREHQKARHDSSCSEEDEEEQRSKPSSIANRDNKLARRRSRSPESQRQKLKNKTYKRRKSSSSESSDDEMERKRQEMMQNAKVRNEQREDSMKMLKIDRLKEAAEKAGRKEKADFIQDMTLESLSSSTTSVEDRIKRGIFSKQRTKSAMDKFMKR